MSPVRARRATPDENSAIAKSLMRSTLRASFMSFGCPGLLDEQRQQALASKYKLNEHPRPYPGKEAACIFSYVTTRMQAMAGQPVEICVGNGLERSRYCLEFHNGHAMGGNHYAFSLQGTVDDSDRLFLASATL